METGYEYCKEQLCSICKASPGAGAIDQIEQTLGRKDSPRKGRVNRGERGEQKQVS